MRRTATATALTAALATALAVCLTGCGTGAAGDGPTTSEPPLSTASPSQAPTSASPSTATSTTSAPSPVPTAVDAAVLLPESAFAPRDGGRTVSEGVEPWVLSTSCDLGSPGGAASMTSVRQGDGQFEVPVGLQQVAVYADATAAQAEAQRVGAAARACAEAADAGPSEDGGNTRYLVEEVPVGADGTGIATDYYGATAGDPDATFLGDYVVVTRRGTAVTLVGESGGESDATSARAAVVPLAQQAWERLCAYEQAGC